MQNGPERCCLCICLCLWATSKPAWPLPRQETLSFLYWRANKPTFSSGTRQNLYLLSIYSISLYHRQKTKKQSRAKASSVSVYKICKKVSGLWRIVSNNIQSLVSGKIVPCVWYFITHPNSSDWSIGQNHFNYLIQHLIFRLLLAGFQGKMRPPYPINLKHDPYCPRPNQMKISHTLPWLSRRKSGAILLPKTNLASEFSLIQTSSMAEVVFPVNS